MRKWFKGFMQALSLLSLSLYCRGVLAAEDADLVKAYIASATPPPVAQENIVRNNARVHHDASIQAMQGTGRLVFMLGVAWLLVSLIRKLGGGKPDFNKPVITIVAGLILIFMGPNLVR